MYMYIHSDSYITSSLPVGGANEPRARKTGVGFSIDPNRDVMLVEQFSFI